MNLSLRGDIFSDPVLGPRVSRANQVLEEIIRSASTPVAAEWRRVGDASGLLLTLSDSTGASVAEKFEPDDLANDGRLRAKLYRIWGDLLQNRSHKQLDLLSGRIQSGE